MSERCSCCKQPIPTKKQSIRVCNKCNASITRHMKWRFIQIDGHTTMEHRHCDNPYEYVEKADQA